MDTLGISSIAINNVALIPASPVVTNEHRTMALSANRSVVFQVSITTYDQLDVLSAFEAAQVATVHFQLAATQLWITNIPAKISANIASFDNFSYDALGMLVPGEGIPGIVSGFMFPQVRTESYRPLGSFVFGMGSGVSLPVKPSGPMPGPPLISTIVLIPLTDTPLLTPSTQAQFY